jgi:NAD(P)-dependent dehydrogenase (short-subunit alcohol dehydrogenase family)
MCATSRFHLDDTPNIAAAAKRITAEFGQLDILVNNAGIVAPGDGPPAVSGLDAIERSLRINFMGSFAVVQAVLPLLREAAPVALSMSPAASARSPTKPIPSGPAPP